MSRHYLWIHCPECESQESMYIGQCDYPDQWSTLSDPFTDELCDDCKEKRQ